MYEKHELNIPTHVRTCMHKYCIHSVLPLFTVAVVTRCGLTSKLTYAYIPMIPPTSKAVESQSDSGPDKLESEKKIQYYTGPVDHPPPHNANK